MRLFTCNGYDWTERFPLSDQTMSARFLAEMLGRPAPTRFGHFDVVELDNGVSLDFADAEGPIRPQHYAFLISEADFDAVLSRIRERGLEHWADPMRHRPGEINQRASAAQKEVDEIRTKNTKSRSFIVATEGM